MITIICFTGFVAFLSLAFIYVKLPKKITKYVESKPLLAEVGSLAYFIITITAVTKSMIGVFAAFVAGALWTLWFKFFRTKRDGNNGQPPNI